MTIQRKGEEIMGWTSYEATYFKKNGDIDRKAECDAYFMRDNAGHYKVVKSSMKGTVYYAAVTTLTKYIGKDENGKNMYGIGRIRKWLKNLPVPKRAEIDYPVHYVLM